MKKFFKYLAENGKISLANHLREKHKVCLRKYTDVRDRFSGDTWLLYDEFIENKQW